MTLKDLINKIANKEELPKMIKFHNMIFTLSNEERIIDYKGGYHEVLFNSKWYLTDSLNDKIEIIEEDKKIEKIENETEIYNYVEYEKRCDIDKVLYILKAINLTEEKIDNLNNKINELIDAVNYMNGSK